MCHKRCFGGGIALLLVVVGALNWGLVGLGWLVGGRDWNVVHMLLGQWMQVEAVVYVLVGLAGVHKIICWTTGKCCGGMCGADSGACPHCGNMTCSCPK